MELWVTTQKPTKFVVVNKKRESIDMNLLKRIFGQKAELTPRQFYFPYFLYEEQFRLLIRPFGLTAEIEVNKTTGMASVLHLKRDGIKKITVQVWQQLMIDNNGALVIWYKESSKLKVSKYLLNGNFDFKEFEFDISTLQIGVNRIENNLSLDNFITFVRSDLIKYENPFCDSFGMMIVTKENVELIPFDWFNKKGGDYGYVWPALAQMDLSNNLLIGEGMRMENFKLELRLSA
jgi:hypothetical protein